MDPEWLDGLSEEWVSQPGSDASPSAQLPALQHDKQDSSNTAPRPKATPSRIPRFLPAKKPSLAYPDNSNSVLSERSLNDINIPSSCRVPSKLSQEIRAAPVHEHARHASRSASASTAGSVIHNTVQQKSTGASPDKNMGHTPEWKRRLIYGDLAYGEQRDLFSSAETGLENIFKPPATQIAAPIDEQSEEAVPPQGDSTMPSSPPSFAAEDSIQNSHNETAGTNAEQEAPHQQPQPRVVKYRLVDHEGAEPSHNSDLDQSAFGSVNEQSTMADMSRASDAVGLGPPATDVSRKTSGRSVIRNEDFSPIFISRQNAGDGKVSFAPMDIPAIQLRQRLEKLRRNQMVLDEAVEASGDEGLGTQADGTLNPDITEDYVQMGGFINLRRGGRSAEGSFRHRLLSPPLSNDISDMLPEESLQASTPKQFPTIRINDRSVTPQFGSRSPSVPPAPHPSPEKADGQKADGQKGPSSPLKLFGPYDTFTNQTLLRRISQFEDQMTDASRTSEGQPSVLTELNEASQDGQNQAHMSASTPLESHQSNPPSPTSSQSMSRFGAGELDGYEFSEVRYQTNDSFQETLDGDSEVPPSPSPVRFDGSRATSVASNPELFVRRSRHKSTSSFASYSSQGPHTAIPDPEENMMKRHSQTSEHLSTPKRREESAEGKRPRTTPLKGPTPKRRRTLHKSDISYEAGGYSTAIESVQLTHRQMQSAMGKKRKDARPGDLQQYANTSVLATRQILRPRTPTPSSTSSIQHEQDSHFDVNSFRTSIRISPSRSKRSADDMIQGVAAFETDRKPSIKTEDFINEANKIMAIIRSKAGLQNGLASVEESELENPGIQSRDGQSPAYDEESFQESTKEPFSRPPSREGRPLLRTLTKQEDPELVIRLKQYEERSDMGDIIGSSLRSAALTQEVARMAAERVQGGHSSEGVEPHFLDNSEIVSDPPNIRISENPTKSTNAGRDGADFLTVRSQSSSGQSTHRSIATGSSRGSESKKTIAPQNVSHLIPDQVGNMVLDRDRNIWIKNRAARASPNSRNILPSEDSEDDPFASIPDLSVDETMELRNLRLMITRQANAEAAQAVASSLSKEEKADASRAGSFADESNVAPSSREARSSPPKLEDLEREIRMLDAHLNRSTPRKKNLTISFSSPIASIIKDVVAEDLNNLEDDPVTDLSTNDASRETPGRGRKDVSVHSKGRRPALSRSRSNSRKPSRHISVGGQTYVSRPISRIEERDEDNAVDRTVLSGKELSLVGENSVVEEGQDENRRRSLSFVLTTPVPTRSVMAPLRQDAAPLISQYVGTLSLSPLSDFTVHHADQSQGFEVSYVVGDRHLITGDQSKQVLSMTLRKLVDKLAEIEPFEPYWEDMRELVLAEGDLDSLHKLDEFCSSLVTLDASNNNIRTLSGVPSSVRELKLTRNYLSELTTWDHLTNLQYVDISNNDIRSLSAFRNLVHLRSLKADNNQIASLDGIQYHDGLQSLRVRGNRIETLDFDGTQLHRLVELDLEDNCISRVENLDQLVSLSSLNLDKNQLVEFGLQTSVSLPQLKYLKLSRNNITSLDVSLFPSLRLLHADRNAISQIKGFSKARRLDTLSLREQQTSETLDMSFLASAYEVRKLFLSGNLLTSFDPPVDFLNLQLLEMANCGLQSLPANLGELMPNLRVVNLNFNALSDIGCLRFIPRMKKLLAAGNRLANAAEVVQVLTNFPHLTTVDLRDNPITQGFYPPMQILVRKEEENVGFDPFSLPDGNAERDEAYASRLDLETRMRRRLYETIFVDSCGRLRKLDGLEANTDVLLLRDAVWTALKAKGLLYDDEPEEDDGAGHGDEDEDEDEDEVTCQQSRAWGAENSFA